MDGFTDFYRTYAPAVRSLCLSRLGDRALAEDACHDTILKAYQAAGRFWPGARVWPWLSTIAHNVCTDVQRRQRREVIAGLAPDEHADVGEPGADDEAQTRMHSDLVAEALRSLPPRQRELLFRYEYQGYSYQDIAELTGTSLPAVRTALMRARQSLRAKVQELNGHRSLGPLSLIALAGRVPHLLQAWVARTASRVREVAILKPDLAGHLAAVAALTMVAVAGVGGVASATSEGYRPAPTVAASIGRPAPIATQDQPAAPASLSADAQPASGAPASIGRSGPPAAPHPSSPREFHLHGPSLSTPGGSSSSSPTVNIGSITINCDQITQSQGLARVVCPIVTNPTLLPPVSHH